MCILVFSACSSVPTARDAAIADTATTALALSRGGVELNPLGFWGTLLGKAAYFQFASDATRDTTDRFIAQVWTTAAVNNALQIVYWGSMPVTFSLSLGYILVAAWFDNSPAEQKSVP